MLPHRCRVAVVVALAIVGGACDTRLPDVRTGYLPRMSRIGDTLEYRPFIAPGWLRGGSYPEGYHMSIVEDNAMEGRRCAYLDGRNEEQSGFGTLTQSISAAPYRNSRIRVSCWLRTEDAIVTGIRLLVTDSSGVDLASGGTTLSGTHDWQGQEVVLDVPNLAESITYGVDFNGPGEVWADGFVVKRVGQNVPVMIDDWRTYHPVRPFNENGVKIRFHEAPLNLSFED